MSKRRRRGKRRLGRELVKGMEQFIRKLESGEPIKVTTVRREVTPDGPLHTRVMGVWTGTYRDE